MDSLQLLQFCTDKAREKKAFDMLTIDLRELSLVCDYFLLMTASSSRQAQAIGDFLSAELKTVGYAPLRVEGQREGRWVLLDCGNVVVHVFQEEERQYYNLERLWGDAPQHKMD